MKINKEKPVLFKDKSECCGCAACFNICPMGAITMKKDEKGFLYPFIDRNQCIGCLQCIKVCPLKNRD